MLAVDWRIWKAYLMKASARTINISFLERVGALRELFRAKGENNCHEFLSGEITREIDFMGMASVIEDEPRPSNLMGLNDAVDEFFDVPEPSNDERSENDWPLFMSPELCYMVSKLSKLAWDNNTASKKCGGRSIAYHVPCNG